MREVATNATMGADGVEARFCLVPPDRQNHYATTGGHILYLNGTNLALVAATWKQFERLE